MTVLRSPLRPVLRSPLYSPLVGKWGDQIPFSAILTLGPQVAISLSEPGALFLERTGASATTPASVDGLVGSIKNHGTLGGWLTAPSDDARPFLRSAAGYRYLEYDATDDVLSGSLAALRNVAGWTLINGVRNTGSTATARAFLSVRSLSANRTRAQTFAAATTGAFWLAARRQGADTAATVAGTAHADVDCVATGIGDYTNTDAFVRFNGVVDGSSTSWLTAGNSDNDGGEVALGASALATPASFFGGRIYSGLIFPAVLSAANLALAERWTAQQMGINI